MISRAGIVAIRAASPAREPHRKTFRAKPRASRRCVRQFEAWRYEWADPSRVFAETRRLTVYTRDVLHVMLFASEDRGALF